MSPCGSGWGLNSNLNLNIEKPEGPVLCEPGLFLAHTVCNYNISTEGEINYGSLTGNLPARTLRGRRLHPSGKKFYYQAGNDIADQPNPNQNHGLAHGVIHQFFTFAFGAVHGVCDLGY